MEKGKLNKKHQKVDQNEEWEDINLVKYDSTDCSEIEFTKSFKCAGTFDGVLNKVHIQDLEERKITIKQYSFDQFYMNQFYLAKEEILYGEYNIESNYSDKNTPLNLMGCLMTAFSNHADVLLSPDDVWITILQGFSQYVNRNAEKLRKQFVNHEGKKTLTIYTAPTEVNKINWSKALEDFQEEIMKNTKGNYAKSVINDFSTSSPLDIKVSQIAIMTSMKKYFEYGMLCICGIRNVVFKGTLEDWQKLIEKVEFLSQYGCEDWTKRLLVVIDEFINTYQGKVNLEFWNNVVGWKDETLTGGGGCGGMQDFYNSPRIVVKNSYISGWILNFYPYDTEGRSIKQGDLIRPENLPYMTFQVPVQYKLPVKYIHIGLKTYFLTFLAGFSGINYENGVYRPQLSFCISKNKRLFDESNK